MDSLVSLPELSQAQRRTCFRVRLLRALGVHGHESEIAKFNSSPGVMRGFCARCGSTLTCENENYPTEAHLHVGVFDDAQGLKPMGHIYREEQLSWLHLTEDA